MKYSLLLVVIVFNIGLQTGCAAIDTDEWTNITDRSLSARDHSKNIFIFYDGTANTKVSNTNVRRMYELVLESGIPRTRAIYIEGVGTTDSVLFGSVFGYGMEKRISRGYRFLAEHFSENDNIYIFGFSRGAHQARALAGLVSYAGVMSFGENDSSRSKRSSTNKIIELTKEESDNDYLDTWANWYTTDKHPLSEIIDKSLNISTRSARVNFLGLWDTVPGSSFKNYVGCKETAGARPGDRYKSSSYPPILNIFHAVSIDEKRSKFRLLSVCPPYPNSSTKVDEIWFPGAHADVGGGYKGDIGLPSISLAWMISNFEVRSGISLLEKSTSKIKSVSNHAGVAHWPIEEWPANFGSDCVDREIPKTRNNIHSSYFQRVDLDVAKVIIEKRVNELPYPQLCHD